MMTINTLAPWFGSNRSLAKHVGDELRGCAWVGVPFAGGMSELSQITARTVLVNDLHRHVINLARVVADEEFRRVMLAQLARLPLHPDILADAQNYCRECEPMPPAPDITAAMNYFICCWMGRSGKSGIDDEFHGRPSIRWNSSGGDSAVRYHSALRSMVTFGRMLKRCTFETMDALAFLARCEDSIGHGLYCDPPFPGQGRRYKHNAGTEDDSEQKWHTRLRDHVQRFTKTRVVMRFYDHPLIRELYAEPHWTWRRLKGRNQANADTPEVLVINGPSLICVAGWNNRREGECE